MNINRDTKIRHISQSHVAPNMSLEKRNELYAKHFIGEDWADVPDNTVDTLFDEIYLIVTKEIDNEI